MLDVIYIAATIAFFGLMLAFVRGLEILGRDASDRRSKERSRERRYADRRRRASVAMLIYLVYTLLRPEKF